MDTLEGGIVGGDGENERKSRTIEWETDNAKKVIPTSTATSAQTRKWSDVDHVKLMTTVTLTTSASCALSHPLYLVLARQQCSRQNMSSAEMARVVYAESGMRGFFRGCFACVAGMVLFETMYYAIIETGKEYAPISNKVHRDFASGVAADSIANPLYLPFSVVSQHQMVAGHGVAATERYQNSLCTTKYLVQTSGFRALFRGIGLQLSMIPLSGAWWALYEQMKSLAYAQMESKQDIGGLLPAWTHTRLSKLPKWCTSTTDNALLNLTVGGFVSSVVTMFANPMYVLRARVQVMRMPVGTRFPTVWVFNDLVKHEGLKGMFRGVKTNIASAWLEGSVFAGTYEGSKLFSDVTAT